jgi:hypothetical protein
LRKLGKAEPEPDLEQYKQRNDPVKRHRDVAERLHGSTNI